MALNPKQERFCQEYVKDLNATQAAKRAGYSEKTAGSQGGDLIQKPEIKSRVDELLSQVSARAEVDAAWLLRRLADEAEADVNDLYDDQGHLKPVKEWPLIWRRGLVAGMDVETEVDDDGQVTRITKVRLSDRVRRLELIGKHIGVRAFEERINVSGSLDLGERLARARNRTKGDDGEA